MLKAIFEDITIVHKGRFVFFAALYAITFALFCLLCVTEGVAAFSLEHAGYPIILVPGMSYAVWHAPTFAVIYAFVSFAEVLFIAWQTNLKAQRLTRFVLFFLAINLAMATLAFSLKDGIEVTLLVFALLLVLLALPTVITIKVMERRGTLILSDIMTPEEEARYRQKLEERRSKRR